MCRAVLDGVKAYGGLLKRENSSKPYGKAVPPERALWTTTPPIPTQATDPVLYSKRTLCVAREGVVRLSEAEEVAYDRVQGGDESLRVELLQRLVRVGEHRGVDAVPRGGEGVHLIKG